MKKIKKIIITVIFIFLSIYQINNNVFALSDEVKAEINYQEGEPEEYDIKIEGSDLTGDIKLPSISFSVKDILYGEEDLLDINFFSTKNNNLSPAWSKVQKVVRNGFKITLYISASLLFTILIYAAVNIVIASIRGRKNDEDIDESSKKGPRKRWENVTKGLRNKKLIEQWICTVIYLALVIIIISVIISFSELLTNTINFSKLEDEKIKVFVNDAVITQTNYYAGASDIIIIGDSRTVQMELAVRPSPYTFISKGAQGYNWMINSAFPEADNKVKHGTKVIIWLGVNDTFNADKYIDAINSKSSNWKSKGATIAYATVGPATKGNLENTVPEFNNKLKNGLSRDIQIIDVYNFLINTGNYGFQESSSSEYLHYNNATSKKIYDYMIDQAKNGKGSSSEDTTIKDFSFETNEEGLFIFQSLYSWSKSAPISYRYIIYASILLLCKTSLFIIYFVRMLLIGLIIIIAPILIIINALRVIEGNRGILKKWAILFLLLVFFNLVIKIIFDILASLDLYSTVKHPIYVVAVHTIILIVAIFFSIKIFKFFFGIGKKKK